MARGVGVEDMAKYLVTGTVRIGVSMEVEATSAREALATAEMGFSMRGYAGNGRSSGALIGTTDPAVTLCADDCEPDFDDAEEIGD